MPAENLQIYLKSQKSLSLFTGVRRVKNATITVNVNADDKTLIFT
jgi:hypothetical protein